MPKVEETLAAYLSPDAASSLKSPTLPTKLCHITSLVSKADLLKDLDEGEGVRPDDIKELRLIHLSTPLKRWLTP